MTGLTSSWVSTRSPIRTSWPPSPLVMANHPPNPNGVAYERRLIARLIEGLRTIPGVRIYGITDPKRSGERCSTLSLRIGDHSAGNRSHLPQKTLIVVQVALSVVLLSGAFLMGRSLANLEHQDFGIATANRYVLRIDPNGAGYTLQRLPALYSEIEDRLSALPSASKVSFARHTPLDGNAWGTCVVQQGHSAPGPGDKCFSSWIRVSRHFLETIGVPIVRGRDFSAQDSQTSTPVVLVDQSFARFFFPNQDPIGKHFGMVSPKNSGAFESSESLPISS